MCSGQSALKLQHPHRHRPAHGLVADAVKRLSLRQLRDGVLDERLLGAHGPHDRLILELLQVSVVEEPQRGPHVHWQGLHWHAGGRNRLCMQYTRMCGNTNTALPAEGVAVKRRAAELSTKTMCAKKMCLQVRIPRRRRSPRALQQQLRREAHSPVRVLRHAHASECFIASEIADGEPHWDAENNLALRDRLRLTTYLFRPTVRQMTHADNLSRDAYPCAEHAALSALCLVQGGFSVRGDAFNACKFVHARRYAAPCSGT